MKKIIRRNTFETNSSSTHSFSYCRDCCVNDLYADEFDNRVHTRLGEFGWEIKDYYEASSKLSYILLVAAHFTDHWFFSYDDFNEEYESFKETEHYQNIEEAVKLHINCDGIVIEDGSRGYIDHQSLDGCRTFDEWLNDAGVSSIEDFIFGDIILHTDNDNY